METEIRPLLDMDWLKENRPSLAEKIEAGYVCREEQTKLACNMAHDAVHSVIGLIAHVKVCDLPDRMNDTVADSPSDAAFEWAKKLNASELFTGAKVMTAADGAEVIHAKYVPLWAVRGGFLIKVQHHCFKR